MDLNYTDEDLTFRDQVRAFLDARVAKYPKEKFRDRMFFGPVLFQFVIESVRQEFQS